MIFRAQTQSLFQIRVYSRLPAVVCEGWVFSGPAPDATCPSEAVYSAEVPRLRDEGGSTTCLSLQKAAKGAKGFEPLLSSLSSVKKDSLTEGSSMSESGSAISYQLSAISYQLSTIDYQLSPSLLRHHFELCIDHLTREPVNRHMRPVMLFAFNNEIVLQIGSIPFEVAGLPNYVEHQIPNAPLINFPKSLGDRFAQSGSCEHFTLP